MDYASCAILHSFNISVPSCAVSTLSTSRFISYQNRMPNRYNQATKILKDSFLRTVIPIDVAGLRKKKLWRQ